MLQQRGENVDGSFPKARPFAAKPLFERLLADVEAIQQISSVECSRLFEIPRSAPGGEPFKLWDIDIHGRRIERHPIGLDHQDSRMKAGDCTPEGAQALAQALSSLFLPGTGPEHRCQLVSRVFLFRSYRQVCEQGLGLPRRERQAPLIEASLKSSKEPKGEERHSVFPESAGPILEHSPFRDGSLCERLAAERGRGAEP